MSHKNMSERGERRAGARFLMVPTLVMALVCCGSGQPEPKTASEDDTCASSLDALMNMGSERDLNPTSTWDDTTFKSGDRVVIIQRSADLHPDFTHALNDVRSTAGHTGTFLGEMKKPDPGTGWIQWDSQEWRDSETGGMVKLKCFESPIFVRFLGLEKPPPTR